MDGSSAASPSMPGTSMASDSELRSLAEKDEVLLEYRLTSMLLALVATIVGEDSEHDTSKYDPPLERSSSHRTLNALANILVRNTEVVAVTATAISSAHDNPRANTLEVFAVQAEADESPTSSPSETLSNITMIPNTEWSDTHPIPEGSWFTTVQQGKSKLSEITGNPWSVALESNTILPLPDHVATVVEYLKEYRLGTDEEREKRFNDFRIYLLSTCYLKIRRRLYNGTSKKLRQILLSITGPVLDKIREGFPKPKASKPSDVLLCAAVCSFEGDEIQDKVRVLRGQHYNPSTEGPSLFEVITTIFEDHSDAHSGAQTPPPPRLLYTSHTCVDFHYLLLLALNNYTTAIDGFNSTERPKSSYRDLILYSNLLWRLANSSILKSHLSFIQDLLRSHLGGGMEPKVKDGKNLGGDSSGDGGVEDGLDTEMEAIENDTKHQTEPGLMVQRWINLLVSHLQALKMLSKFSSLHPAAEVQITQVAVKRTTFDTPQDWTAVLERTVKDQAGPLETQLPELEARILENIEAVHKTTTGRKGIYAYFQGKNIVGSAGQVHCEAGLAAYLNPGAPCLAQETAPAHVLAVSKLCCPLCWDLLGVYRDDRFGVRGHHSALSAVELPGSISLAPAKHLLSLLRGRLYEKLRVVLVKTRKHRRNDSAQSIGSVASDDSNPSDTATVAKARKLDIRYP